MRIVLDSNVLVRVVISTTGPAAAAYGLIRPPHHVLLTSVELLSDVADALRYPRLRAIHGFDDAQIDAAVLAFYSQSEKVLLPPDSNIPAVCRDRDDDFVIATAVEGHADVLCTRDKDLHDTTVVHYCKQHRIEVLTDTELLVRL
jgi:putative PIN family toxin of toxin-antitoxin system